MGIFTSTFRLTWAFNHLEHKMQIDLWIKKVRVLHLSRIAASLVNLLLPLDLLCQPAAHLAVFWKLKLSLEAHFLSSPQHFVVMKAMHILLFYGLFSCPYKSLWTIVWYCHWQCTDSLLSDWATFDFATIAFNGFRWFRTIGQTMRWFRWIVVVYRATCSFFLDAKNNVLNLWQKKSPMMMIMIP